VYVLIVTLLTRDIVIWFIILKMLACPRSINKLVLFISVYVLYKFYDVFMYVAILLIPIKSSLIANELYVPKIP